MVNQCVILVGGLGTRLGPLTETTPKPLLPISGRPFLEYLVWDAARFGFTDIVLLAGYRGDQIVERFVGHHRLAGRDVSIRAFVEPSPAGTAGALRILGEAADDNFVLINGDSWFDIDLRAFASTGLSPRSIAKVALRHTDNIGRAGHVVTVGDQISEFRSSDRPNLAGLINCGVYLMSSQILAEIDAIPCSLESDVFPRLAARGNLVADVMAGFFIDIGVPDDYRIAKSILERRRNKPAVFFDRDGVLVEDSGYVHRPDQLRWKRGAVEAIRDVNRSGCYAFVVTNQAGVARGFYSESDVDRFHRQMDVELSACGAHIDEFRYSPYHPDGIVERYRKDAACRKPRPGMILELLSKWGVDPDRCALIGDKTTDIEAAYAAGIVGYRYDDTDLCALVANALDRVGARAQ